MYHYHSNSYRYRHLYKYLNDVDSCSKDENLKQLYFLSNHVITVGHHHIGSTGTFNKLFQIIFEFPLSIEYLFPLFKHILKFLIIRTCKYLECAAW